MFRFAYSKEFLRWALQVQTGAGTSFIPWPGNFRDMLQLMLLLWCCGALVAAVAAVAAAAHLAAGQFPSPLPCSRLLQPPGFQAVWHCGVRVSTTGKLVAFISGIPATVRVNSSSLKTVGGWWVGGLYGGLSGLDVGKDRGARPDARRFFFQPELSPAPVSTRPVPPPLPRWRSTSCACTRSCGTSGWRPC